MKSFFGLSFLAIVILLSTLEVGVSSCTKETLVHDTIIKKDTVLIQDTILTTTILTAHAWKLQELRGVYANTTQYYLRGGTGNTDIYDNEYILFKSDKTGNYVNNAGIQYNLTWDFGNAAHTKITYVILNYVQQPTTTITWENIIYKGGNLKYDEYYSQGYNNSHMQGLRIPR